MSTYTDSKLKDKFEENFKEVWNALSLEEAPKDRQIGNQNQRDNFDRVYNLYLILHKEYHKPANEIGPNKTSQENYRGAVIQAFHAQPYHNLPKFRGLLHTGFVSEKAENRRKKDGKIPTPEHVYPRHRTLEIDLFDPEKPLTFKEFIYHYISKGGLYSETTPSENKAIQKYHGENPKAIKTKHWRDIYKSCEIKEFND